MKSILGVLSVSMLAIACGPVEAPNNEAGFITLLGNDTLAVEKFEKIGNRVSAQVVLRSPRTRLSSYELILDDTGGIDTYTVRNHPLEEGFNGSSEISRSYAREGDSLITKVLTNDGTYRDLMTPYEPGILPFIDMVHWPFELAFNYAAEVDADSINQRLITGSRASTFVIAKIASDSMTIRHPSRGVMGVDVNAEGDIMELDAGLTTRKLVVSRTDEVDIDAVAKRFAEADKNGSPFGALSGAVTETFTVGHAEFEVSYGSPKRRGRDLFGGIVPFGQRWRTGANRATHFKTSKDLKIGSLTVPAAEYTLFTIPEADGGTLIINKQTGQNGRTYDESRDLGRVPMTVMTKSDNTEDFTITVEEGPNGGRLNLIWGETVYYVDFTVQ
ncbi:DUF2911 domain-containing protein [Balneola vulgaris]|uniref:DUF2911 domain-containing protein n=1 Tax=Balneola vulgaris TaxID=287535 RepID=UPI0003A75731|nr:DUF2911 domain-containing protein [Balneola vulgaris]